MRAGVVAIALAAHGCGGHYYRATAGPTITSDGDLGAEGGAEIGLTLARSWKEERERVDFWSVGLRAQGIWLPDGGARPILGLAVGIDFPPAPDETLREVDSQRGIGWRFGGSGGLAVDSPVTDELRYGVTVGRGRIGYPGCNLTCSESGCNQCSGTWVGSRLLGIELAWSGTGYFSDRVDGWWRMTLAASAMFARLRAVGEGGY